MVRAGREGRCRKRSVKAAVSCACLPRRHGRRSQHHPPPGPVGRPEDLAGCFRIGLVLDDRPYILTTWVVVTTSDRIAGQIARLLGGEPRASRDADNVTYEVVTQATVVDIVLGGPAAIETAMVLRDGDKLLAICDGRACRSEEGQHPCECPVMLAARRRASGNGHGCEPATRIYFRLACCPALGSFTFSSGSWSVAEQAAGLVLALSSDGGPTHACLALERNSWRSSAAGEIYHTRPTLAVVR